ncbi:hypothetical protein L6164_004930 [Bauhinia variegata]|uniref:Uncharacterized protein n=1 Tax=Bauhinia variegata TaxID=167791 RepID=A0ACB9PPS6_BAUVA|nr:hypothetical protein L6164_004930 [Bauhinia variegata]
MRDATANFLVKEKVDYKVQIVVPLVDSFHLSIVAAQWNKFGLPGIGKVPFWWQKAYKVSLISPRESKASDSLAHSVPYSRHMRSAVAD